MTWESGPRGFGPALKARRFTPAGFPDEASLAMKRGKSVDFIGYWQRHVAG
jgi:hypothetical protein